LADTACQAGTGWLAGKRLDIGLKWLKNLNLIAPLFYCSYSLIQLAFARELCSLNGEDPPSSRDSGEARWSFAVSPSGETEALATVEFRTEAQPLGWGASLSLILSDRINSTSWPESRGKDYVSILAGPP